MKRVSEKRLDILFIICILLIVIAYFINLFLPTQQFIITPDFGRSDAYHMSISSKFFLWEKLHQNEIPLWSKNIDAGFPVSAEGQIGTFFLPNLLLFRFFDFVLAYNLSLMVPIIIFGLGMYAWIRNEKFSPLIALYGALTLTFSGIIFTHLTHVTLLQSLCLMPVAIWIMSSLCKNPKLWKSSLLAIVLSQQLFAGFVQAVFITGLFLLGYVIWDMRLNKHKAKTLIYFVLSLFLTIGLSAIFIFPAKELLTHTTDPNGFFLEASTQYSFPIKHLMTFIDPFLLGNPKFGTYPPFWKFTGSIFWENTGYIGITPLLFIAIGFFKFRKNRHFLTVFFVLVLLCSLLLMLGSHSPLYFLYSFWPLNLFRVPSRFIWLFTLALVGLSVIYADTIVNTKLRFAKLAFLLLVALNTFMLWQTWRGYNVERPAAEWLTPPPIVDDISSQSIITRVSTIGAGTLHNQTFLTSGWQKMEPYVFLKNTLYPNSNLIWHIPIFEASVGRYLRRNSYMNELLNENLIIDKDIQISSMAANLLSLNSVSTLVLAKTASLGAEFKLLSEVKNGDNNIYVYQNTKARPRVYLAQKIYTAKTLSEATKILSSTEFYQNHGVLLEEKVIDSSSAVGGEVELVEDFDTLTTIKITNNPQANMFVLADTYFPGWNATIDDKPTKIYPANIRQRAVLVPSGNHVVQFKYQPTSFRNGLCITLLSYSLLFVIIVTLLIRCLIYSTKNQQ